MCVFTTSDADLDSLTVEYAVEIFRQGSDVIEVVEGSMYCTYSCHLTFDDAQTFPGDTWVCNGRAFDALHCKHAYGSPDASP